MQMDHISLFHAAFLKNLDYEIEIEIEKEIKQKNHTKNSGNCKW